MAVRELVPALSLPQLAGAAAGPDKIDWPHPDGGGGVRIV
jgi:hypothetical protein